MFCPSTLKRKVFSIIAKGNIDHNARSTTATKHYHGTSMTVMQFLSEDNRDETQSRIEKIEEESSHSKKVLQIPPSYTQPEHFYWKKKKCYAPVSTVNIPEEYLDNNIYDKGIESELNWLNDICLQTEFLPWATYHSEKNVYFFYSWKECSTSSYSSTCSYTTDTILLYENHPENSKFLESRTDTC